MTNDDDHKNPNRNASGINSESSSNFKDKKCDHDCGADHGHEDRPGIGHSHSHKSGHHHHHHHHHDLDGKKLYWAVIVNLALTLAQFVGGILSGSLSLLADALHNFSDAGSLIIAAVARKIAKRPGNKGMTYGYRRAEVLGALINSTTLVIVGLFLIGEAIERYFKPQPIDGFVVIVIAALGILINTLTAFLTHAGSKSSINIKAAFIHNVSDAMASVVVVISGFLILKYQVYWIDLVATVLISAYILYHSFFLLRTCLKILMQSTPEGIDIEAIKASLESIDKVNEVHHIHVWQLDDEKKLLECHFVISESSLPKIEEIKTSMKSHIKEKFSISHSTLEVEITPCQ